eukprot:TRINITY_DN6134_c0_g2_i1.p1 TRINITY_DN6134_c0_g2~~TRINITY_DN6134_c0_g2_i1.p1  ORF type:complete len:238 (+),score=32.30 TRINITY_DN6134_c0_g2_i1:72-716(+)
MPALRSALQIPSTTQQQPNWANKPTPPTQQSWTPVATPNLPSSTETNDVAQTGTIPAREQQPSGASWWEKPLTTQTTAPTPTTTTTDTTGPTTTLPTTAVDQEQTLNSLQSKLKKIAGSSPPPQTSQNSTPEPVPTALGPGTTNGTPLTTTLQHQPAAPLLPGLPPPPPPPSNGAGVASPLPPGWDMVIDVTTRKPYFVNTLTKQTTWVDPRGT